MKTRKKHPRPNRRTTASHKAQIAHATSPFVEHLHELRRRLYFIAASILLWGCVAYSFQQHIVNALLKPAHGQHFIYTSPGGGIDFLFRICVYSGIILSLPVIVYNVLRFIEPVVARPSRMYMVWGSVASALLALFGLAFGYFLGLPAALHFLLHQFTTVQIQPLVTIQSYLGFVIAYMIGSALLFQLPLILIFINRIKPLRPRRLLHYERWVILAAFVLAGLMNPSPNVLSQLIVVVPFILMYQIGILLIALLNRRPGLSAQQRLHEQDIQIQATRQAVAQKLQPLATPSMSLLASSPLPEAHSTSENPRPYSRQEIYAMRGTAQRNFDNLSLNFSTARLKSIDGIQGGGYSKTYG